MFGGDDMNRDDFPMLSGDIIYFDNGATTLKPKCVIDKISDYYCNYSANAHRGDYKISVKVDSLYEGVRDKVRDFINANSSSEIVFTSGCTDGINRVVFGYFKYKLKPGDEVLITESEHASNILPWFILEKSIGIKVKYIPLDSNNEVTISNIDKVVSDKTRVISLAYITNVIGDIRPIRDICEYAHKRNILVMVDGAQSASHIKMDMQVDDIDFLTVSAHKMCGPTGVGFLYGKFNLLSDMVPISYGGGMNAMFLPDGYMELREVPIRFEAGTQNIAGVIGMGEAIDYLNNIGFKNIVRYEHELKEYLVNKMSNLDNVIMYNANNVGNTLIFNIRDVFSQDTSIYLDKHNICIRAGNHCAKILNNVFDVNNTCRISLSFYNTREEIDKLIEVLSNSANIYNEII